MNYKDIIDPVLGTESISDDLYIPNPNEGMESMESLMNRLTISVSQWKESNKQLSELGNFIRIIKLDLGTRFGIHLTIDGFDSEEQPTQVTKTMILPRPDVADYSQEEEEVIEDLTLEQQNNIDTRSVESIREESILPNNSASGMDKGKYDLAKAINAGFEVAKNLKSGEVSTRGYS